MVRIRTLISDYIWFIKESQNYMEGHNKIWVFLRSLPKGFKFCYHMNKVYTKQIKL